MKMKLKEARGCLFVLQMMNMAAFQPPLECFCCVEETFLVSLWPL